MTLRKTVLFAGSIILLFACQSKDNTTINQYDFPFQNPSLTIDERIEDLISRMTREEKVNQLFNQAPAIERLKVPAYNWWNEALHGVARAGKATVFPQAIGMAATFNEDLMLDISNVISDEGRAKHNYFAQQDVRSIYTGLTFWSPNINIFRDPRWGRGQETYGEDPYLTSRMAVNFIKGIQGNDEKYFKAIATAKHYAVHSGPEFSRHSDNFYVNDRDLYQTYLPAFKAAIEEANVQSVMCAYNRFREQPCCGSDLLLQQILRDKFGFEGYVVTDCGAVTDFYKEDNHGLVDQPVKAWGWALAAGADLNCEEAKAFVEDNLDEAFEQGLISEANVNRALKRLFKARFQLGMFDQPEDVPFANIPYDIVGKEEHLTLAKQAARESLVLLKNDGVLPLKEGTKIALIGPNADNEDVLLGNYNGVPVNPSTPLAALQRRMKQEDLVYTPGGPLVPGIYGHLKPVPSGCYFHYENGNLMPGLKAAYFKGDSLVGVPAIARIDSAINFEWALSPISGQLEETFAVSWEGVFIPEKTGTYIFNGTADLILDGKVILDQKFGYIEYDEILLEAGRPYKLQSKYIKKPHWWANLLYPSAKLVWVETSTTRDYAQEALAAAEAADVIVFFGGISPRLEGEEMKLEIDGFAHGDRTHIELPENQKALLKKLHASGKPIIYINFSGSAIALNWENDHLPAIIQAFYPGEATGEAVAELLFGEFSPSGRLPITFYKSVEELPPFSDYQMAGRTYRYFLGDALFPFGHGLSYSSFQISNLSMPDSAKAGEEIKMMATITNTGNFDGYETILLYLTDEEASTTVPLKTLVDIEKIYLTKGESRQIELTIKPEQMSVITPASKTVIEPGRFQIGIVGSDLLLKDEFELTGNSVVL
ncbi:MAG: beta-glucosidase [Cyclobacteriaceae bacterium]|nr:beta-glucosidase [Cyclobacteriaceae bacterium]